MSSVIDRINKKISQAYKELDAIHDKPKRPIINPDTIKEPTETGLDEDATDDDIGLDDSETGLD